jgi:sortase A
MFNQQGGTDAEPKHQARHQAAHPAAHGTESNGGSEAPATPGTERKWRLHLYTLIPALLALAGLVVLMYPMTAAWFSQYDQSKVVDSTMQQINSGKLKPSVVQQLDEAHAYNKALSAGAILEANHRIPTGSGTSQDPNEALDYHNLLVTPSGVMARLRIPAIDVDLPVYHGTSDETLLKGVGHLEGTSLPVGGVGTHAVLTGHRGLATAVMFTNLDRVKKGNTFTIDVMGQVLTYKVFDIRVVDPEDTASLKADPKKDLVTLVTCTPLGINSQRILVTGQRVHPTPKQDITAAHKASQLPRFPWWAVILAAGLILVILFVWRAGYPPKPRHEADGPGGDTGAGAAGGAEPQA